MYLSRPIYRSKHTVPTYHYGCPCCGTFSLYRPMSEYDLAQDCPDCGTASNRVLVRGSAIAGMDAGKRAATAVNERSAHTPRRSATGASHGPGCGCCGGTSRRKLTADGLKGFPSGRPWMLSH
jgi:putative FmdB family regulatory protein